MSKENVERFFDVVKADHAMMRGLAEADVDAVIRMAASAGQRAGPRHDEGNERGEGRRRPGYRAGRSGDESHLEKRDILLFPGVCAGVSQRAETRVWVYLAEKPVAHWA